MLRAPTLERWRTAAAAPPAMTTRGRRPDAEAEPGPAVQVAAPLALIASPTPLISRRWSQALSGSYATHQVAARAALERDIVALRPALLLVDLALPGGGISALPALRRLSPATKILLFTEAPDEKEAISALRAGARGYYTRDIDPRLLKKAMEVVQKGEVWVGRNVIPHLLSELAALTRHRQQRTLPSLDGRLDRLTPREREVARLVGSGASNKEIADQLHITERTVKAHLTAIFRKLGLSDRLRLALFVSTEAGDVAGAAPGGAGGRVGPRSN